MTTTATSGLRRVPIYLAAHVLRYASPLISTPLIARALGTTEFGHFAVVMACAWTASIIAEFGFYASGLAAVAAAHSEREMQQATSAYLTAKLLLVLPCVAVYFLLYFASGGGGTLDLGLLACGMFTALALGLNLNWYFQGRQEAYKAAALELASSVILNLMVVAAFFVSPTITTFLFAQLAAYSVPVIVILTVISRRHGFTPSVEGARKVVHGSLGFFSERVMFTLYTATSPIVVAALSGVHQAGLYSIADKVSVLIGSLAIPVAQALAPGLVKQARSGTRYHRDAVQAVGLVVAMGALAAIVTYILLPIAIELIYTSRYSDAVAAARILCLGAAMSCATSAVAAFWLLPRGESRFLVMGSGLSLIVWLGAQFILTQQFGAVGAAWARVLADAACAIFLVSLMARQLSMERLP